MGTGAPRWKAVAGSGAKLEAPEPVADVPETLDHTHRHGESQWVKATSAVVGLVQEGQAAAQAVAPCAAGEEDHDANASTACRSCVAGRYAAAGSYSLPSNGTVGCIACAAGKYCLLDDCSGESLTSRGCIRKLGRIHK